MTHHVFNRRHLDPFIHIYRVYAAYFWYFSMARKCSPKLPPFRVIRAPAQYAYKAPFLPNPHAS